MNKIFLDTNIWIYAYSNDIKKNIAINMIEKFYENILISTQNLNELYVVLTKKKIVSNKVASKIINDLMDNFSISLIEKETIQQAIEIQIKYKLQYFDSLLLSSALENSCKIFYSEDMQHNLVIENRLKIINPFKIKEYEFI